ncbi:MAG: hypothetical protein K9K67_15440 [Bacteriovoracaceae bacterium]|nr:hypothetical protein [Bacteriovoracaceae bacterium]
MLPNVTKVRGLNLTMKAKDFYYLGDYKSAASCSLDLENAPYIIGASAFRGDHVGARRVFKDFKDDFGEKDLVFTNFHMGISFTRTSDYHLAKEILLDNWKKRKSASLTGIERFFIYQGLSFFRFFFSKHSSSLFFASLAEEELSRLKSPAPLLVALVNDLIAHNYFQLGRPAKGEVFLKKAIKTTKESGLKTLREEFLASLLIYKSQFSTDVNKYINELKKLLAKTSESNDYTRSELVLQISKLYLLKGSYQSANTFLIKNFNTIYKNDNKRKVAKLNTLLAQLLLQKGQLIEALSLLKVAKQNLNEEVDFNLLAPILGIEKRVLESLGQDSSDQEVILGVFLRETDKGILKQIHSRMKGIPIFNEEDQLGILFDKVYLREESVLEEIINKELFHLASFYFSPLQKKRSLIIHPMNTGIFLFSEEETVFRPGKVSKNHYNFLKLLSSGPQTKEKIIQVIWGYSTYDPIRHDHLVYTLVRRLRVLLGERKDWILAGEDQYSIDRDVDIVLKFGVEKSNIVKTFSDIPEDINFRQIQIIQGALKDGFSANDVAEYFKTTRMTSFRDLDDLLKRGLLIKRGKSRGTRYFLS